MEREILEDVQRLYGIADKSRDYALQETISHRFLNKETKHIKDLGDMIQQVARVAKVPGHGKPSPPLLYTFPARSDCYAG